MSNGNSGKAVLTKAIDDAIQATSDPVTEGVCPSHDSLRQGMNTLLLCKRDEMESDKKHNGFFIGPVGPFENRDGYRLVLIGLILYAVLVAYGKAPLPGPDVFEQMNQPAAGATSE